jgi:hypothetical protein
VTSTVDHLSGSISFSSPPSAHWLVEEKITQTNTLPSLWFVCRKLVVRGTTSYGESKLDNKPAIIFDYPYTKEWDDYVRSISESTVDYTAFTDEIREHSDIPGLYIGIMWIKPRRWINSFNRLSSEPFQLLKFALMQVE